MAKLEVAIVGAGIAGLAQAIRLKERHGDKVSLTIYEKAGDIGGVWRDAQWPCASVDILIHVYQLYSDLNPNWNRAYASRAEVFYYWQSLVDKYDLRSRLVFNTAFTGSWWNETEQLHDIELQRVDGTKYRVKAHVLVSAAGPLNTPRYPNVPGRETFQGIQFHSSRWDPKLELENRRFAVIGSGSTAVQLIPGLASMKGVTVTQFMRSPGWYFPKFNFQFPAIVKAIFAYVPGAQWLYRVRLHWAWNSRTTLTGKGRLATWYRKGLEKKLLNFLYKTAPSQYHKLLTPDYPFGVKRIIRDDGWLKCLNQENVELVSAPIKEVTETGLVTNDGTKHEFDVIVWATGYEVATQGCGLNINVHGLQGRELAEYWSELKGPEAYLGVAVPGWPNYFIVVGPNSLSNNWGQVIGTQTLYIAKVIGRLLDKDITSIHPTEQATSRFNGEIQTLLKKSVLYTEGVTSWDKVDGDGKITVSNGFNVSSLMWRTRKVKWGDWVAYKRQGEATKTIDLSPAWSTRILSAVPVIASLVYSLRLANKQLHLW